MQILISSPNLHGALSRFSLLVMDLAQGIRRWVETRAYIDPQTDLGITGILPTPNGVILAIQSPSRPRLVRLAPDLTYLTTVEIPGLKDPHGLATDGRAVYVASTGTNEVHAWNPTDGSVRCHWRFREDERRDALHLSSLAWHGDRLLATTHHDPRKYPARNGVGCILDLSTGETLAEELDHPHTLTSIAGKLYLVDSAQGGLMRLGTDARVERRAEIGGFVRGIASVGEELVVGVSSRRLHSRKQGPSMANEATDDAWLADHKYRSSIAWLDADTMEVRERQDFSLLAPEIFDIVPFTGEADDGVLLDEPEILRAASARHELWMLHQLVDRQRESIAGARKQISRRYLHDQVILDVDDVAGGVLRGVAYDPSRPGGAIHVRVILDQQHVFYARADMSRAARPSSGASAYPRFELTLPASLLGGPNHRVLVDVPDAARCEGIELTVKLPESRAVAGAGAR